MASIVAPDGTTRRALMMILGGRESTWESWRDHDPSEQPDVYLRVVPRSAGPVCTGHPATSAAPTFSRFPPAGTSGAATAAGSSSAQAPARLAAQQALRADGLALVATTSTRLSNTNLRHRSSAPGVGRSYREPALALAALTGYGLFRDYCAGHQVEWGSYI